MRQTNSSTSVRGKTAGNRSVASRLGQNDGFSLVEIGIGLMLACTLAGFALINMGAVMPGIRANQAMYQTVSQLRQGRQLAIAQRREIQLRFTGDTGISLVRNEFPEGEHVLSEVSLNKDCQFIKSDDIDMDTPDEFGPDELGEMGALDFGGADTLTFLSDGTLVDELGNPVNGTIFIGLPDHPEMARAVTILGATGRIRGYRWTGEEWIQ
jgi:type II secretory pathway pseudopilin PulG